MFLSQVGVVAMPDDKWQEVPCAFITLKSDYLIDTTTTDPVTVGKVGGFLSALDAASRGATGVSVTEITTNVNKTHKIAPTEAEIIAWCRSKMAHYQAPKKIVFADLPKTTTGKIQKNVLRDLVRSWKTKKECGSV